MQEFDVENICRQILISLGGRRILLIGPDVAPIIVKLLGVGIDAYGLIPQERFMGACEVMPARILPFVDWQLPYADHSFDTIAVFDFIDHFSVDDFSSILANIKRVSRSGFMVTTYNHSFEDIEAIGYSLFLRRNLSAFETVGYENRESNHWRKSVFLEPIPEVGISQSDLVSIALDMSRQSGRIADAQMVRYQRVGPFVPSGGAVLDIGCGAGYGTAMIARHGLANKIIGVDVNASCITYAQTNFQEDDQRIEFYHADATDLGFIADNSIDVIAAFDLFDSMSDNRSLIKEMFRVLAPGGRVIASVRNMWCNEKEKPAQYFNWSKFRALFKEHHWLIEKQEILTSGGSPKLPNALRQIRSFPPDVECPDDETEWCTLVVMKTPLLGTKDNYTNRLNPELQENPRYHFTQWQRDYDNPALISSMIIRGLRVLDGPLLTHFAAHVAEIARPSSADQGGALCVLAYQLLEKNAPWFERRTLLEKMASYLPDATIHARRWRISLDYVSGLLYQSSGFLSEAKEFFIKVAKVDVADMTPTLGTKTVQARCRIADICFGQKQDQEAIIWLIDAIKEVHRLMAADWLNVQGLPSAPISLGLREMTSIMEQAAFAGAFIEASAYRNRTNLRFYPRYQGWPEMSGSRPYQVELQWREAYSQWLQWSWDMEKNKAAELIEENRLLREELTLLKRIQPV